MTSGTNTSTSTNNNNKNNQNGRSTSSSTSFHYPLQNIGSCTLPDYSTHGGLLPPYTVSSSTSLNSLTKDPDNHNHQDSFAIRANLQNPKVPTFYSIPIPTMDTAVRNEMIRLLSLRHKLKTQSQEEHPQQGGNDNLSSPHPPITEEQVQKAFQESERSAQEAKRLQQEVIKAQREFEHWKARSKALSEQYKYAIQSFEEQVQSIRDTKSAQIEKIKQDRLKVNKAKELTTYPSEEDAQLSTDTNTTSHATSSSLEQKRKEWLENAERVEGALAVLEERWKKEDEIANEEERKWKKNWEEEQKKREERERLEDEQLEQKVELVWEERQRQRQRERKRKREQIDNDKEQKKDEIPNNTNVATQLEYATASVDDNVLKDSHLDGIIDSSPTNHVQEGETKKIKFVTNEKELTKSDMKQKEGGKEDEQPNTNTKSLDQYQDQDVEPNSNKERSISEDLRINDTSSLTGNKTKNTSNTTFTSPSALDTSIEDDTTASTSTATKQSTKIEQKTDDLAEKSSEIDKLNQTKSQMIWLLKQVIIAQKKHKLKKHKASVSTSSPSSSSPPSPSSPCKSSAESSKGDTATATMITSSLNGGNESTITSSSTTINASVSTTGTFPAVSKEEIK